ncbi:MobF family relaxase [Trichlorobacter lovleyi]|uniref:MobF family relaxase n=1 Tax=Trichlorobacter lovleyi TaxID=313985 RepID=UPI002480C7DB|nr:MobF family relaxase [Trichlorobacter lovleyi]
MMSAGSGMSAAGAASYYYEKDPMLSNEAGNGQWVGTGAEKLGLSGEIRKSDFVAVLNGQDPRTGEQLVEVKTGTNLEDRRAGNDYTFSAPKSVSVAFAAGVEGIKEAHDKAVLAVAAHMEQHYSQARTPEGFANGSLLASKFDHSTSRALDPQLHSHLFGANMTQTKDDKWRANEPLNVYKDQKALGELYRQELANELQQQGHKIEWTDRATLQFEIASVDKQAIEQFSQRREAIEKQVAAWKEAGEHKNVSEAKLYEMAALNTRADKDKSVTKEQVEGLWKEGFEKAGTSIEKVKGEIEAAKQQPQVAQQQDKLTPEQAVKEAARILTDKEAVIDRAALLQTAARIDGGQHDIKTLSAAVESQTVSLGQTERGRELYTTQEMKELEARNVETMKGLGEFKSVTSKEEVNGYLDKLEKTEGVKLSEGQRTHVLNELAGDKALAVTQGDPGTGKTFGSSLVERFNNEVLKPSGREHYTLNVAFTGKAASEMSDASGKPAWTIDSFLNAYSNGKIQVSPQQEVNANDKQAIQGVNQAAQSGLNHQEQASHFKAGLQSVTTTERNGTGGYFSAKGERVAYSLGSKGLESEHRTHTGVGFGVSRTDTNRDNADGSRLSSTTHHHGDSLAGTRTKSGTLTRPDGQKIEYSHERQSFLGGLITKGEKMEIDRENGIGKLSVTKSFGDSIRGTTTTFDRYGNARETKWEGTKGKDGIEISKSETRHFQDQKLADKHLLSAGDKAVRGFVSAVRVFSNDQRREAEQNAEKVWQAIKNQQEQKTEQSKVAPQQEGKQGNGKAQILIPQGAQVVLRVDEASFVGARQGEHLLNVLKDLQQQGVQVKIGKIGDFKQMQSISGGDLFRQAQNLAKSGYGDFAAMKEINRQKDEKLLDVAKTLNRDGDRKQLSENARDALKMLNEQGRVTEIKDRSELVKATVDKYMREAAKPSNNAEKAAAGEKQSVLLVTALNKDRVELNQSIREARIEAGEIQKGNSYQVQTPAQTGPTADSYKPGMQVQFTGERNQETGKMQSWGAPLQTIATVQSINTENNSVRVMYSYERNGETKNVTKEFNAAEMQGRVSASNQESRNFSAGDRIAFGKNDKDLDVKNGNMATITSIDDKGNVTARIDGQKEDKSFNLSTYNNIDHGYAVTTEKSQGATVESSIVFANMKDNMANDRAALQQAVGKDVSAEKFNLWNSVVSSKEESWSVDTNIKGHAVTLGVSLIKDKQDNPIKAVSVAFKNGPEAVKDEKLRTSLRNSGFFYSKDSKTWNAAMTNPNTTKLIGKSHPLADRNYQDAAREIVNDGAKLSDKQAVSVNPAADIKDKEQYSKMTFNALNVAVTRATNEAHVMTTSKEALGVATERVAEKTSTVDRETLKPEQQERHNTDKEQKEGQQKAEPGQAALGAIKEAEDKNGQSGKGEQSNAVQAVEKAEEKNKEATEKVEGRQDAPPAPEAQKEAEQQDKGQEKQSEAKDAGNEVDK